MPQTLYLSLTQFNFMTNQYPPTNYTAARKGGPTGFTVVDTLRKWLAVKV